MKRFLLLILALTLPVVASAKPRPVHTPATTPVAIQPPEPLPESVPMARQRTVQEDLELRDWIVGIQTTAQDAVKRADSAESEAKASRDQTAIAQAKTGEALNALTTVQKAYDTEHTDKLKAEALAAKEKERADKEAKESARRGNVIGWIGGALLAALFSHLLFLVPAPYKLIGMFALPAIGGIVGYFVARILI